MQRNLSRILLILLLFSIVATSINFPTVKATNWLVGWKYRKSHVVNPATGAGANYQMNITVYYAEGEDSLWSVYLDGKCRTDFGDIRFTDDDGFTELHYFILDKTDSSIANFWINITDSLESNSATIYIYYGKSDATTTSDGANTFPLFDDLSTYSINDAPRNPPWTTSGTDANNIIKVVADPGNAGKKCFAIVESADGVSTVLIGTFNTKYLGIATYFRFRYTIEAQHYYVYFFEDSTPLINTRKVSGTTPAAFQWYDGSTYKAFNPALAMSVNTWATVTMNIRDTGKAYFHTIIGSTDGTGGFRGTPINGINWIDFESYRLVASTFYIGGVGYNNNYIFSRKFTSPEPTHGAWGNEEVFGAWNNITTLNFDLLGRTWFGITTLPFSILGRTWLAITTFPFNLQGRILTDISNWIFNLRTLQWFVIRILNFKQEIFKIPIAIPSWMFYVGICLFILGIVFFSEQYNKRKR